MGEQSGGALPHPPAPGNGPAPPGNGAAPPGNGAAPNNRAAPSSSAGQEPPQADEPTPRMVAGRYRLAEPLGHGAMGIVWRARDELLHRDVAVKEVRLPPSLSDNMYQLTLREARTAARLSHPGVAAVHDVVEEAGRPWIVMELVHARSLDQILAEDGPLPPRQAADLGLQVLAALATAHRAGVLHRDVKPSNVLITRDGRAVLTDFGIATLEGDASLTQSGIVMGSPGFLAPERIRGGVATPASDLWSLGATLYAAVEGQGPYDNLGGAITTMTAVVNEDPPPPKAAGPLRAVISALLAKDPAQRPNVAEARYLLESITTTTSGPAASAPAGPDQAPASDPGPDATTGPSWAAVITTTMRLWLRRHGSDRRTITRLATLALALAAVGGLVIVLSRHPVAKLPPAAHHAGGSPLPSTVSTRAQAAAWTVQQISHGATVACDPAMCPVLEAHGFPAGGLVTLPAGAGDPLGSDVVIATAAIRSDFGSRLSSVYAPLVIASIGSGPARIDIRVTAPDGAPAYMAALRADRRARRAAGAQLLRNRGITVSAQARAVIAAGSADSRILMMLAVMASRHPEGLQVVAFGSAAAGAAPDVPLRSVEIAPGAAGAGGGGGAELKSLQTFALAQRSTYLPASAQIVPLPDGMPVLRIEFRAPSPLGLLAGRLTP